MPTGESVAQIRQQ